MDSSLSEQSELLTFALINPVYFLAALIGPSA